MRYYEKLEKIQNFRVLKLNFWCKIFKRKIFGAEFIIFEIFGQNCRFCQNFRLFKFYEFFLYPTYRHLWWIFLCLYSSNARAFSEIPDIFHPMMTHMSACLSHSSPVFCKVLNFLNYMRCL